ncbi:4'-phosphopantetheinyl transferase family protein [Gilvimarinus xylanilyticus]|uniref:4'-phosphopantetheinyl transferase superfamily protein n=1 Tax=Gilvimarinus xylanilyticus TaxID=2944139 RepID=A0A9X2I799_9GAMM|nr:4'-phosphopantetheinyl transferase superfamily protein [Gilvimarinus xylanilyticus]
MKLHLLSCKQIEKSHGSNQASWLSDAEQARAQRLRSVNAKRTFISSRLLCRAILAQELDTQPQNLSIALSPAGKPYVENAPDLHFNLSHSGQWIALGVSHTGPVGVDIEQPQKQRPLLKIAQQFFHPEEVSLLQSLPAGQCEQAFYRLWTLKEAFFKARGTGIAEGLAQVNFAAGNTPTAPAEFTPGQWHYFFTQPPVPTGEALYLACVSASDSVVVEAYD